MKQEQNQPKVSVVVPIWNPGSAISRCIASLQNQTLKDIEILFVDDRGTDGAMELVRAAAEQDPRIRILQNPENMGAGVSRNAGIEAARGEYLSFVDSDDYVNEVFLERLYQKAISENLDIVKGRSVYILEDGTQTDHVELNDKIRRGRTASVALYRLFTYQHHSALYRRALLEAYGIRYGESRRAQDTTFLLKVCHRATRFDLEESARYFFCENMSSLMHDTRPHTMQRTLDGLREKTDYILEQMPDDPDVVPYLKVLYDYLIQLGYSFAQREEHREAVKAFREKLREQMLRMPELPRLKKQSIPVRVLLEEDRLLPRLPFKLPWDKYAAADFLPLTKDWCDELKAHPEDRNAFRKQIEKLFFVAGEAVKRLPDAQQRRDVANGLWQQERRLPLTWRVHMVFSRVAREAFKRCPEGVKRCLRQAIQSLKK